MYILYIDVHGLLGVNFVERFRFLFKADCKRTKNKDKMHSIKWTCIVILLRTYTTAQGSTKLTCAPVYPKPSYPVICECEQSSGNDIQWLKDNVIISACVAASDFCSPKPSGYVFSNILAGSVAYYNLTISSYDYSDCGLYTCKDFASPPASDDVLRSLFDFDSNSLQMEEPLANHSNGIINFTTECIFESSNVSDNIKWYKVVNGKAMELDPNQLKVTTDSSSCKQCSGEYASKLIVKYEHTEAHGDNVEEVQFQISMFHDLEKDVVLNRTTKNYYNIKSVITSLPPSTTPNNVSDGCIDTCDCCDCDIKELIIVIAVAWASAITLTFVGSCILKYSLRTMDFHECFFKLGSLPWIFLLVVVLLYKGDKKRGLIPLVISFVLDAVFIGIDRYYVCSCENICGIELQDHLWASLIYVMVCAVLSVLKYIILEKCCESDSTVSNSESDVGDKHEQRGARPLPPMTNVSSRLGNEKEHAHSLTHVKLTHRSPLPPISPKKNS